MKIGYTSWRSYAARGVLVINAIPRRSFDRQSHLSALAGHAVHSYHAKEKICFLNYWVWQSQIIGTRTLYWVTAIEKKYSCGQLAASASAQALSAVTQREWGLWNSQRIAQRIDFKLLTDVYS